MAKKKLKPQHHQFAMLMASGTVNQTVAYMECYPDSTYDAAKADASRLLTNATITEEINRIRNMSETKQTLTKQKIREIRQDIATDKKADHSNKLTACRDDVKMMGWDEPDRVDHKINIVWGESEG